MTPEEENKLLKGPFPWRGPGFAVTRYGLVRDLPPSPNWKKKAWQKNQEERREEMQEVRERVYEDTKNLSRSDLQATIEMTRDELILRWDQLEEEGEKMVEAYEDFREWIAERLQDAYREEPEGAKWPYSLRGEDLRPWNEIVRTGRIGSLNSPRLATQHAKVELRALNPRTFNNHFRTANTLLRRYSALRYKRLDVAWGTSGPDLEEYTPSKKPKRLLQAVAKLDEEKEGLAEADSKAAIYRLVHARLNGGEMEDGAAKRLNEALRGDMKRGGFTSRFPETPEKLVELAQTLSQRWDNVVPLSEPER